MRTVLACLILAAPAVAQESIYEQGTQFYQAGDYQAAVESFEAVLAGGFESSDLRYNLGNAHFKNGSLGLAILAWERALVIEPGSEDVLANLELARGLTVDDVQPLPRFWLLSVISWWVDLIPRGLLLVLTGCGWLALWGGMGLRVLARGESARAYGTWVTLGGLLVVLVLGLNLVVREAGLGRAERGVILAEVVPVRSAPTLDDDQTVFEVHEGTRVRIDQRTDEWAEVVLDDGKVGWVPVEVMGVIQETASR